MEMQSGAVVVPEKFGMQWYNHQQQPPHYQVDEREGFIIWLRGEFAAANAIIDALCHHFRAVGEPGEYDRVVGTIQQRRCNWNPILHMQQYFSVADVVYALQQVSWKRQHRGVGLEGSVRMGLGGKEFRRGARAERGAKVQNSGGEVYEKSLNNGQETSDLNLHEKLDAEPAEKAKAEEKEEKKELNKIPGADSLVTNQESMQVSVSQSDDETEGTESFSVEGSALILEEKQDTEVSAKTFVATEICDGKSVNVAEGMKLYKDLFDDSEISKLITSVNDIRAAGRKGQLQGQMFVIAKRPMKGHGRETIQFGVPLADTSPEDEAAVDTSKDLEVEPIPESMQDVIEQLLMKQVISIKPDSCIIDIFNEGDHSQPHIWPQWFGRPICVLFLKECEMSFGKAFAINHPGVYRGALKLSLSPGSVLVVQGKSSDFARHAIPSLKKQRIIVTLVKSQPKRINASSSSRTPSVVAPPSGLAPPPSKSPSHIRPVTAKPFGSMLPSVVLPPSNCVQPIFIPGPMQPGIAFASPVTLLPTSAGWPAASLRHPQPHLPIPGTGVFLPSQGSSNPSKPAIAVASEDVAIENDDFSSDVEESQAECNGIMKGPKEGSVTTTEEEPEKHDSAKSAEAA